MNLIIKFYDGQFVAIGDIEKWSVNLESNNLIESFKHFRKVNQELVFENAESGDVVKRFAKDIKSIEFEF